MAVINEVKERFSKIANFFPKQKMALGASRLYKYLLYGGTKGSGKSRFLRFASIYWLIKLGKIYKKRGIRGALFCEDYPSLKDRHLSKLSTEFPAWLGTFHANHPEQGLCFILNNFYGGGILAFRNLDDPSKYESSEFAIIAVDELQKNPLSTFKVLRKRLRWPGIEDKDLKFIAAAIPEMGGELYVTQYWVDKVFPPDELEAQKFYFVQALPHENPYLAPEYLDNLRSGTEEERQAYFSGNFHAFDRAMDESGWMKLLSPTDVQKAQMDVKGHFGVKILAIDPGAGVDESAIVLRSETQAEVKFNQKTKDTMAIVPLIMKFMLEDKVNTVVIDIAGLGKPIYDRLVEVGIKNLIGVNFGGTAKQKDRYENAKAELFDHGKEWVQKGGKLFRNEAWNELSYIKYKIDSERTIKTQKKQDLLASGIKSPNVADAFALTFAEDMTVIKARIQYQEQARDDELFGVSSNPQGDGFGFTK